MENRKIGPEVRCLNNLIKREFEASPVKAQLDTLTGLHGWVIGRIARHDGPVYQRDLERWFSVRRSTVSNVLSLMEKNGLIERRPCQSDARLKQIVLTDRAREFDKIAREDLVRIENKLSFGISDGELVQFFATLDKIKRNIEPKEENHA